MKDSFRAALDSLVNAADHYKNQVAIAPGQWVEFLSKARAVLNEWPDWQPIASAPQDGTEVIVWDGTRRWIAYFWEGDWWSTGIDDDGEYGNDFVIYPTHYQDAPLPP